MNPIKLQELIARARQQRAADEAVTAARNAPLTLNTKTAGEDLIAALAEKHSTDSAARKDSNAALSDFVWNKEQQAAIDLAQSGVSFCLIGSAGTGKTTVMKAIAAIAISSGRVPPLRESTKFLRAGSPGMVNIAYTRRATNNIRRAMSADMYNNCLTFHKLVEYEPEYYDVFDSEAGKMRSTMRFEPMRNRGNLLPTSLNVIAVEESSMFSTQFEDILLEALRHEVQFIFLGDINQLPPVYGSAVLGFKLLSLPVIELKQVYRQALKSPIIRLAHRILSGTPLEADEAKAMSTAEYWLTKHPGEFTKEGAELAASQINIRTFPKRVHWEPASLAIAKLLKTSIDSGKLDPEQDIILVPINGHKHKDNQFGSEELNKHIAQHLTQKRGQLTHEIIAGYESHCFAIGDKVMYDKEDAIITDIQKNVSYMGSRQPQEASLSLDRWGAEHKLGAARTGSGALEDMSTEQIDAMIAAAAASSEDRVLEASHIITIKLFDSLPNDEGIKLKSAGEINSLALAYAMTIHKAQGCEWRKVYLIIHHSHNQMVFREMLYTAVTRAREEITIICEPDTFTNGTAKQRIKGNTLVEKAEYFKGKQANREEQRKMSEELGKIKLAGKIKEEDNETDYD